MSVVAVAVLLVGSGSASVPVTVAEFVNCPAEGGVTAIVTVALPRAAILPRLQFTVAVPLQLPCEVVAEINVSPAGNASATLTFVAVPGPLFMLTMRYESGPPPCPGFGDAVFVTDKSALEGFTTFNAAWTECCVAPD